MEYFDNSPLLDSFYPAVAASPTVTSNRLKFVAMALVVATVGTAFLTFHYIVLRNENKRLRNVIKPLSEI